MDRAKSEGVFLRGLRLLAKWDRYVAKPTEPRRLNQSRVLRILGPASELFAKQLELDFREEQDIDLVETRQWLLQRDKKMIEYSFTNILARVRI